MSKQRSLIPLKNKKCVKFRRLGYEDKNITSLFCVSKAWETQNIITCSSCYNILGLDESPNWKTEPISVSLTLVILEINVVHHVSQF